MTTDAIPVATFPPPSWSISAPCHSRWPHPQRPGPVASSSHGPAPYSPAARAPRLHWQLVIGRLALFFRLLAGLGCGSVARTWPPRGAKPRQPMLPDARSGPHDKKAATITSHTVRSIAPDRRERSDQILQFLASRCQKWALVQAWDRQQSGKGTVPAGLHTRPV